MQINDSFDSLEIYLDSATYNLELVNQLSADTYTSRLVCRKITWKGVLTHHGQMPKYVQNKMINLFNSDNNYNLLLGTNSISEGKPIHQQSVYSPWIQWCYNSKIIVNQKHYR